MTSMTGKTALVTGATAGIGQQTALELARLGARVVIVGRDAAKTRGVVEALKAASGSGSVDALVGDLSAMAEVRRVAAEYQARFGALHVLVNNVGAVNLTREVTADGFERTFAMNHLGVFLLTNLLLPALERAAPARIVVVSSDGHRVGGLDFDDLQSERGYSAFPVYGRSKLMNVLFTRELSRRLEGRPITVNALHPGVVASNFMKKPGLFGSLGHAFMGVFGLSVEKGARTSVYLASSPEVDGVSGRYFARSRQRTPSRHALDDGAARRLWDVSEQLTGLASGAKAA